MPTAVYSPIYSNGGDGVKGARTTSCSMVLSNRERGILVLPCLFLIEVAASQNMLLVELSARRRMCLYHVRKMYMRR